jgi:hypothetical protein
MLTDPSALRVLACDISRRPDSAPALAALAASVRRIESRGHDLVIDFDAEAESALAVVVAAERLCCAQLGWQLEQPTRLRVVGSELQLELVARLLGSAERKRG